MTIRACAGIMVALSFPTAALAQTSPIITTFAGTGNVGTGGDGGPATTASFGWISDVTTDDAGNIYIADFEFGRIRKVDALTGTIATVAGGGAIDLPNEAVPATEARLGQPGAIAIDAAGNLFISDGLIRRVDAVTGLMTTYAGGGEPAEFQPLPVPVNGQTHIFVPSPDGVPALGAFIPWTNDLAFDAQGNLVVATMWQVRRIDAMTGMLSTITGQPVTRFIYDSGPYYPGGPLPGPAEGVSWSGFYSGDGGPASEAGCGYPAAIAFDAEGSLYIADYEWTDEPNNHVRRVDAETGIIDAYVGTGAETVSGDGGPALAATTIAGSGIMCDHAGNLYITEYGSTNNGQQLMSLVRQIDAETGIVSAVAGIPGTEGFAGDGGLPTDALLNGPFAMAFDPDGNLYIADSDNYRVRKITFHRDSPPTAVPGPDQSIHAGSVVSLDGAASFDDNTPSASLAYGWSFISAPVGSTASLDDPAAAAPSFTADLPGTYILELVVQDSLGQLSPADEVVISSMNLAPTAVPGPDQVAVVGDPVLLSAQASTDPELDDLTYQWYLVQAPLGSTASLLSTFTVNTAFVPDLPGSYVVELIVDDGFGPSASATVLVTAITGEQFAENAAMDAIDLLAALDPAAVTNAGNQNALVSMLNQVIQFVQSDNLTVARTKLQQAIERTDGCALRGRPDANGAGRDWITDCDAQADLYAELTAALDAITP